LDPSGHDVVINGVNVEDIYKAVMSGDYGALIDIGNQVIGTSSTAAENNALLIAYGTLRGIAREKLEILENSNDVFEIHWTPIHSGSTSFRYGTSDGDNMVNFYDIFIPDSFTQDTDGAAIILSHEVLHAILDTKFGPYRRASVYEEALAADYAKRVGYALGYESKSSDAFWLISVNAGLANLVPFESKSGSFWLALALRVYAWPRYDGMDLCPTDEIDAYLRSTFL
jgi:hypothetical protein